MHRAYMCSYNAINGTASCADKWMHVDVVKNHWGWSGVIESDCGAVRDIAYGKHGAYPHGQPLTTHSAHPPPTESLVEDTDGLLFAL